MNRKMLKALLFGAAPLLLAATTALGDEGVDVNVTNDSTEDVLVTVYDLSVGPHAAVLSHVRINGFTTVPVSASPDAYGRANLAWTAISADANDRKCGHQDVVALGNSESLAVHADSSCNTSS